MKNIFYLLKLWKNWTQQLLSVSFFFFFFHLPEKEHFSTWTHLYVLWLVILWMDSFCSLNIADIKQNQSNAKNITDLMKKKHILSYKKVSVWFVMTFSIDSNGFSFNELFANPSYRYILIAILMKLIVTTWILFV